VPWSSCNLHSSVTLRCALTGWLMLPVLNCAMVSQPISVSWTLNSSDSWNTNREISVLRLRHLWLLFLVRCVNCLTYLQSCLQHCVFSSFSQSLSLCCRNETCWLASNAEHINSCIAGSFLICVLRNSSKPTMNHCVMILF